MRGGGFNVNKIRLLPACLGPLRRGLRLTAVLGALLALTALGACSRQPPVSALTFVGKWQSSRLATPIYLAPNGEWEIRKDDGAVLQYGAWEYQNNTLIWSFRFGDEVGHDVNAVVQANAETFQLREADQSITIFKKLD